MYNRYSSEKMISMTAAELAAVRDAHPESIHTPPTSYTSATDERHDGYGCDRTDHHVFDHNHPEDVFPY